MIRRSIVLAAGLVVATWSQTKFNNALTVTFGGRGILRIHTESTLSNSPLSTNGVVAVDEGDVSHRMVIDRQGKVMFAYDISLAPVPNDSTAYTIRLTPAKSDYFIPQFVTFAPGDTLQVSVHDGAEFSGSHTVRPDGKITINLLGDVSIAGLSPRGLAATLKERLKGQMVDPQVNVVVIAARRDYPTIVAAREFQVVRLGEAVSIDILFNPSTGEKIFDVIQPVAAVTEKPRRVRPEEEISLERITISINGRIVKEMRNNWIIGTGMKLSLPGKGTAYIVVQPSTSYPFQPVGRVDGTRLTFPVGNDFVEIVSRSNVLKTSEVGTVWVYHDKADKSAQVVDFTVGALEDLLPKR